jgi:histidinol-phosphatase (PHP family)
MVMLADCHIHLQPHGEQPPMTRERIDRYVEAGRERGVTTLALTEHLFRFREAYDLLAGWWDDDPDPALTALAKQYWDDHVSGSVADYVREIERAKSAGVPVLLGIEMDWIRSKEDQLREFLAPYDWDIVLGSVHYIGAWGFDDARFIDEWAKRDVAGAWADYGALVAELAATGLADVLAHPDLPKVFGHRPRDETPLHAAIVGAAAPHGTGIELNSNGIRRCQEIYPAMPLLERARAAGLPITLASDAHVPERVGANFDDLIAWARRAGYDEASVYVGRERRAYPISEST